MLITKIDEKKKPNAGFTLVEIVVVFIIMIMLASLSVVGILEYQDYADFKRQNSYAQTLFLAAQTKLTGYSVRGQLPELVDASSHILELKDVTIPDGSSAKKSGRAKNCKQNRIYYLTGNKENYAAYQKGEYKGKWDMQSRGYQALYDIFDEFVFDKTILEGTIALEYNPVDGLVYSVLYSDKCGAFTYVGYNEGDTINILNRKESYRSKRMIGYYGLE